MAVRLMRGLQPAIPLVLASGSAIRAQMLMQAGLEFEIRPADVDEATIRDAMIASGETVETGARVLAEAKAVRISETARDALVIGADQILEHKGRWFEKPRSLEQARDQLSRLSGGRHRLISSVVLVVDAAVVWQHVDEADLTVRDLSDVFISDYLRAMGDTALSTVGGYQLEGLGAQLFSRIDGDFFTILGLPLLPLLDELRARRILGT